MAKEESGGHGEGKKRVSDSILAALIVINSLARHTEEHLLAYQNGVLLSYRTVCVYVSTPHLRSVVADIRFCREWGALVGVNLDFEAKTQPLLVPAKGVPLGVICVDQKIARIT